MQKQNILLWQFFEVNQKKVVNKLKKKNRKIYCPNFLDEKYNNLIFGLADFNYLLKNFNNQSFFDTDFFINFYKENFSVWIKSFFSRGQYRKQNYFDLDAIFKCQSYYVYSYIKKKKITHFITGPHFSWNGFDYLAASMAKSLNVKTIFLLAVFRNRFFYTPDYKDWGFFKKAKKLFKPLDTNNLNILKINKLHYMDQNFYLTQKFGFKILIPNIFKIFSKNGINFFLNKFFNFKENLNLYKFWIQENHRNFITKKLPKNYIYFPIHLQPESTTIGYNATAYIDQALCVEKIHAKLPPNFKIIIKEHPAQEDLYHRGKLFYKRISFLKNVIFTNVNDSSEELIKKSSIVATVTGTVGWEAIRLLKPVITFGNAYYNFLPGIFFWNKNINIKKILQTKISEKKLVDAICLFSKKMGFGLDSVDYSPAADFTSAFKKEAYNESREVNTLINSLETILKEIQ
jgi:hypothetical protein